MDEIEELNEKVLNNHKIIIEIYESLKKDAGIFETIKKQFDRIIESQTALTVTVACLVSDNLKSKY